MTDAIPTIEQRTAAIRQVNPNVTDQQIQGILAAFPGQSATTPTTPVGGTVVPGAVPTGQNPIQPQPTGTTPLTTPIQPIPAPTTPIPAAPTPAPQATIVTPPAPVAPTTAVTQPGAAPAVLPSLQYGSKGSEVSSIQSLLGVNPTGNFLSQTQAAVKAFQASNGLTVDGVVGPETMAALQRVKSGGPTPDANVQSGTDSNTNGGTTAPGTTPPTSGNSTVDSLINLLNNQSPQKSATDVYKEVYTSLGLTDMKTSYEDQTKEFTDLQEKKNDEADEINNNPWYSEGVRVNKLKELDSKYEGRETILTNKLKLLETGITNGRADAQFITGQVLDQLQQSEKSNQDVILKAIDIAEKEAEAESKLQGPTSVQEYEYAKAQGYTGSYIDYQNDDANRKARSVPSSQDSNRVLSATEAQSLGVPFGTTAGSAYGITPTKLPTEAMQTVATYVARMNQANPTIDSLADKISKMNLVSFQAQKNLPAALQSSDYQLYDQAARNFVNATLRRESGSAINDSEFTNAYKQYMPQPGDTVETLAEKEKSRDIVAASFKKAAGSAYESVDDLLGTNSSNNATNGKGNLTSSQYVEKVLSSKGIKYDSLASKVPAGKIGVIDNNTGDIGYISESEYSVSKYTRI